MLLYKDLDEHEQYIHKNIEQLFTSSPAMTRYSFIRALWAVLNKYRDRKRDK